MDFMASSPPKGTGKHRYIFLAFLDNLEASNEAAPLRIPPEKRPDFKVASKHLGQLVGATFYLTQNE